ncbi:MAG TPA: O-antigen ligase family protein [Planctomycetota bacterium]
MSARASERLFPWLLALPALLFATPLSPLVLDPYPHLAGTGWAVLALVPLALGLLLRGATPRGAWPFLATLAWALVSWRLAPVTDTFEARRALLVLCFLPLAVAGGAALDARGRATLAWIAVGLSIAWTGFALLAGGLLRFVGVLGDTGSLSQAALPGAAIGALWLVRATGARRIAGGLALALFLGHVAAAPVLAGAHTLLAGLLLVLWRGPAGARPRVAALALVALLAPFAGMAVRQVATGEAPAIEGLRESSAHSLGGLGVRALVWRSALGLIGDHALLGAGPGQFQAAFPPHRDPREIELSRHGVCSELDTEVEHAHNDWLQAFCELGLPGGLLFALALALCARAAWRRLGDERDLPFAVAALALLVNSLVHAPLWANPAAAVLGAALLGTLTSTAPARSSRLSAVFVALPLLCAVPATGPLVRHGRGLRDYVWAAMRSSHPAPADLLGAIQEARAAAPDAVPALLLWARGRGPDTEPWTAVLERRPSMVEAWEQSGTLLARRGATDDARGRYLHALALSPTHPRILRNLARLELVQGDLEAGLEVVATLRASGCLDPDWLAELASELVLGMGRSARGARLCFASPLEALSPEELHERAVGPEQREAADTAECLAQLLWGRAHAASGAFDAAVRSYRQATQRSAAWRAARGAGSTGPAAPLALELAAAQERAGRRDEALRTLEGLQADAGTWAELPGWAREALTDLGLGPGAER